MLLLDVCCIFFNVLLTGAEQLVGFAPIIDCVKAKISHIRLLTSHFSKRQNNCREIVYLRTGLGNGGLNEINNNIR